MTHDGVSCPGYEIAFVFDNVGDGHLHASPPREQLAAEMSEAWLAFARTGDPSHDGIGDWQAYEPGSRSTMIFQRGGSELVDDPSAPARQLWARRLRRSVTLA